MKIPCRPAVLLVVWGVALAGCAPTPADTEAAATRPDKVACASEAEQLLEPVAVHVAPATDSALLVELGRGSFVYRCERRGEWLAIMFPETGQAVDCTVRTPELACPIGWVEGEVTTTIYG